MTLTADQTWEQIRWEQRGINQGIARYRAAAELADPTLLPPGQTLLRAVIPPLIETITSSQTEAAELALTSGGRPPPWIWMIQLLSPEKLAVIAASTILRSPSLGIGARVLVVGKVIGKSIRAQVERDRWEARMLSERVKGQWDALATFKTLYPSANVRQWRLWRKRIDTLETTEWTPTQEVILGGHLVHLAVQACPAWFGVETTITNSLSHVVLVLTPAAKEILATIEARSELVNPRRLPMIVPPLSWRYE